ncbi:MAG: AAA family ATPase [Candidatus Lokiarchaeota archaeon]|nr:AAA family ATPase [Candidatus Lokiarchaeota archaeon]
MITEIGINRFKGIQTLKPIKIKPVTILCGKNSSGKTSILESFIT